MNLDRMDKQGLIDFLKSDTPDKIKIWNEWRKDNNFKRVDLSEADLSGLNLSHADLYRADLSSANLYRADLSSADLSHANLSHADLYRANLYHADLSSADLSRAKMNWQSRDLIAEIIKRQAGDSIEKRMIAGLIIVSRDMCWKEFIKIEHSLKEWSLDTLAEYVQDGDDAPNILKRRAKKMGDEASNEG